jgi:SAM-dependent methyltransferase
MGNSGSMHGSDSGGVNRRWFVDFLSASTDAARGATRNLDSAREALAAAWAARHSGGHEGVYLNLSGRLASALIDYGNPRSLGHRLHAMRISPLLSMIEAVHAQQGRVRLVDIGGLESYWSIVPRDYLDTHNVTITIVNLPGTPMPRDHGRFEFIPADGRQLDMFQDCSFDIAHSNSVIEHVGDWERMVAFAHEIVRVAPSYFVQTPYYWFPIEPHFMAPFFHWLPESVRVWAFLHLGVGFWGRRATKDEAVSVVESARLLDRKRLQALFGDAQITTETFAGLPKSLIAIKR